MLVNPPTDAATESFERLRDLVSTYRDNRRHFEDQSFQEAEARNALINKLFIALGWDVTHETERNPYRQEVKIEHRSQGGERDRRADYAFYAAPNFRDVQFIVEAKKPSVTLSTVDNYFQAIRYGWNSQIPIVVLTNFCELHILDCRVRPSPDTVLDKCIDVYSLDDYDDWDRFLQLYYLLSRESVHDGSISDYAEKLPKLRGRTIQYALFRGGHEPLDDTFLSTLEELRLQLARTFYKQDPSLSSDELTEAVQRVLDRLVLIRFLEDKYIEPNPLLTDIVSSTSPWRDFIDLCKRLNRTYNGIVFRPHPVVDDRDFHPDGDEFLDICSSLDYHRSPYNFDSIPVDVLGRIYERFLENVLAIYDGNLTIERRPELRKTGGVYYTPASVCRFIVESTLGRTAPGLTATDLRKVTVLDPACGSGSFLIEAADQLFREYTTRLNDDTSKFSASEYVEATTGLRPSLHLKRQILVNQLFGIDVDHQAVEVAQLSLYLKLLEDETLGSVYNTRQGEIPEAVLPSLDRNILHGNSLLDPTTVRSASAPLDEQIRLAPLSIANHWPRLMESGGFDVVVGNPPYFSIDDTWGANSSQAAMLKARFPHIHRDKTDILFYFMARATELAKGVASFIVSRAFLEAYKGDRLRSYLSHNSHIDHIVDFQNYYVFPGIGITTAIVRWSPGSKSKKKVEYYRLASTAPDSRPLSDQIGDPTVFEHLRKSPSSLSASSWTFSQHDVEKVNAKIDSRGQPISEFMDIGQGMQTGANKVFAITEGERKSWKIPDAWCRRRARNSDIDRFWLSQDGPLLLFTPMATDFSDLPEGVVNYLTQNKQTLMRRAAFKRGNCEWWNYTWPLHVKNYTRKRIWCPYLATDNRFALDDARSFVGLTDTTVIFDSGQGEDLRYLVGVLNSTVMRARFQSIGKLKSSGIREYFDNTVGRLPIRRINFKSRAEREAHDKICEATDMLQELMGRKTTSRSEQQRSAIDRQIEDTEDTVDRAVFQLYGLSDTEAATLRSIIPTQ